MLRRKPLKRGKPPERRKPLKTKTRLSRGSRLVSRPARRKAPAGRWNAWRRAQYDLVRRRSLVCEAPGCGEPWTDRHHPFGRRGEPWTSSALVLVLLCRRHHREATGQLGSGLDVELRRLVRDLAVRRLDAWMRPRFVDAHQQLGYYATGMDPVAHFDYLRNIAYINNIVPPP